MQAETKYHVGDRVKIYEHPLTERSLEGEAILAEYVAEVGVYEGRLVHAWRVRFVGETATYYRVILEPADDSIPIAL